MPVKALLIISLLTLTATAETPLFPTEPGFPIPALPAAPPATDPTEIARLATGSVIDPTRYVNADGVWARTTTKFSKEDAGRVPKLWQTIVSADTGLSALHLCAMRKDHAGMQALLKAGHPSNVVTTKWKTSPLKICGEQQDVEGAWIILGIGPDSPVRNKRLTVMLDAQRVILEERDGPASAWRETFNTRTSTGRKGYKTPSGRFFVSDKHRVRKSSIYHVNMPWFLRLSLSAVGLHQGSLPGYPASHGCIRLPGKSAQKFFKEIPVGTEVLIH